MLVYGISSSGATLYVHYCCGKVDRIEFVEKKKSNCPFANKIARKGCCDNKQVQLKIKNDYKVEAQTQLSFKEYCAYHNYTHPVSEPLFCNYNNILSFTDTSPPLISSTPVYISNCVFRI